MLIFVDSFVTNIYNIYQFFKVGKAKKLDNRSIFD